MKIVVAIFLCSVLLWGSFFAWQTDKVEPTFEFSALRTFDEIAEATADYNPFPSWNDWEGGTLTWVSPNYTAVPEDGSDLAKFFQGFRVFAQNVRIFFENARTNLFSPSGLFPFLIKYIAHFFEFVYSVTKWVLDDIVIAFRIIRAFLPNLSYGGTSV